MGSGTLLDVCPCTHWLLVRLSGVRPLNREPEHKRGGTPESSPLQDSWRSVDKTVGHSASPSSLHRGHLLLLLVTGLRPHCSHCLPRPVLLGAPWGRTGPWLPRLLPVRRPLESAPGPALTVKGCRRCGVHKHVGSIPVSGPCVAAAVAGS